MSEKVVIVVPWHNPKQREEFESKWGLSEENRKIIVFQQDEMREGCAVTKNKGIARAVEMGAQIVIVLDDDCYPAEEGCRGDLISYFVAAHVQALDPIQCELPYANTTTPRSRGTPFNLWKTMPVAASMGFWSGVPDFDAIGQLTQYHDAVDYHTNPIYGRYWSMSGMNIAFRPKLWGKFCEFVNVKRYDDIWMGWLWMRHAYERGYCFNLGGPRVWHARQSNVWQNLRDESKWIEQNETLWLKIAMHPTSDYESLRALLPV